MPEPGFFSQNGKCAAGRLPNKSPDAVSFDRRSSVFEFSGAVPSGITRTVYVAEIKEITNYFLN